MVGKLDDALQFHRNALNLRAYRQQLLASNIANTDTPHFKAMDIDFSSALREALSSPTARRGPVVTSPRHLVPNAGEPLGAPVLYRASVQPSVDGNTVDLDVERAQFADNAIHYEASLAFISGRIKTMLAAIQG